MDHFTFGMDIHAQKSEIHSKNSDPNHYFGVDSTTQQSDP